MRNATPPKTTDSSSPRADLVVQGAADIKLRLSKNDVLDLCVNETKVKIDTAYETQRALCIALQTQLLEVKATFEKDLRAALRKRYGRVLRALANGDLEAAKRIPFRVEVDYRRESEPEWRQQGKKFDPRPSEGFRPGKYSVEKVGFLAGDDLRYSDACGAYFKAAVKGCDIDVPSLKQLKEKARELTTACDRLDRTAELQRAFKRDVQSTKRLLLRKILDESEKGREVLALIQGISAEVNMTPSLDPARLLEA